MNYDLEKLSKARIGVIGDFCLDVYWLADMRRSELSRETPHFPLPVVEERLSPGGAGNVVANLLALEPAAVHAVGVCGDDWRGMALRDLLGKAGADVGGLLSDPSRVTNTYVKPLRAGYAENVVYEDPRLDFANYDAPPAETEDRLIAALDAVAGRIDILCVCDQLPFGCVTDAVREHIAALARRGLAVVVDSRDRAARYSGVILKVNVAEAAKALGGRVSPDTPERLAAALGERTGRPAVVTAGEGGCCVADGGRVTHVPARKVTGEIDFCGAGDTFLSAFAAATAGGFALVDAARIACCASAVTIRKLRTTGTANRTELAASLREYGA